MKRAVPHSQHPESWTDEDVAKLLGIQTASLRARIERGVDLPPWRQIPGFRHRIWLRSEVLEWLDQFKAESTPLPKRGRPGRPPKAEQDARRDLRRVPDDLRIRAEQEAHKLAQTAASGSPPPPPETPDRQHGRPLRQPGAAQ